jgi:Zn-finger nucleic acid-binding protein
VDEWLFAQRASSEARNVETGATGFTRGVSTINPQLSSLDEQSGFLPDLFSTHPPVDQRLKILLDMAHGDAKALEQAVTKIDQRPRQQVPQVSGGTGNQDHWMLHKDGQWQGPFPLDKIIGFDWIRPDTWIQKIVEGKVKMAQEEPLISQKVYGKQADNAPLTADSCPRCQRPLVAVDYEGVQIEKCPFCQGTLVSEKDVQRLILRREVGFSEKIQLLVEGFKKQQEANFVRPKIDPQTLYPCVKCRDGKSRMLRMFYTAAYPVEVDKCVHCGSLWFDPDELEALQYLIESNTQKK